jgi:hypothetical protein
MIRRTGVAVACLAAFFGVASPAAAQAPEDAAQAAADSWLGIVDSGNYGGSWDAAARLLRASASQATWAQTVEGLRAPLGALKSRTVKSRGLTEKPPMAFTVGGKVFSWTAGKYVVVQYDSAFAGRGATETVVVMGEPDGWRVASYSVR